MVDVDAITDSLKGMGEGFGRALNMVFGSQNARVVKRMAPLIAEVASHEAWAEALSDEDIKAQTETWKKEVADGKPLNDLLPQAFAITRVAAQRTLGMRHYDVQIIGGAVLHSGSIAEMATGEGKTLAATLAAYLNSLAGKVFVVTVNDYLAKRDAEWMTPVYEFLGLQCGSIQSNMSPAERQPVYAGDIIYATNNELGFDYLRDNMKSRVEDQVQHSLDFAIIDEVDSILIDEARTPLIISGPATGNAEKYRVGMAAARQLNEEEHFETKEKEKSALLTEEGIVEGQKLLGIDDFYSGAVNMEWPHILEQCLRALHLYKHEVDYVVKDGAIIIVDEFTGRMMEGRRWGDGLHQAVEAKEGIRPKAENQTLATITFQNYFRIYGKLSGMTGTALTEAGEFAKIYDLDVVQIPTNRPIKRLDEADVVYLETPDKWKAIAKVIEESRDSGQPVLVGTTSIENSELLSGILNRRGIRHNVLNAKQHENEAHIIAQAGRKGAVTVATNMAGRGTDIVLGGNTEAMLPGEMAQRKTDVEDQAAVKALLEELNQAHSGEKEEVIAAGGLYVIGTERHESRRIDNQLRGRSGRQGDPGRSRFYLSLDDPLMRRFYKDWVKNFLSKAGMGGGEPVESKMVSNAIKKAQKKVEDYHFEIRKNLLEYDEVMNEQRKMIYGQRQMALKAEGLHDRVIAMAEQVIDQATITYGGDGRDMEPDWEAFRLWAERKWGYEGDAAGLKSAGLNKVSELLFEDFQRNYAERTEAAGEEAMAHLERFLLLNSIDKKWKEHLYLMDALRSGIGLRGYAQVDPKNEYKREGLERFEELLFAIADEVTNHILRFELARKDEDALSAAYEGQSASHPQFGGSASRARPSAPRRQVAVGYTPPNQRAKTPDMGGVTEEMEAASRAGQDTGQQTPDQHKPKAARNAPCPCGSGKKYKQCHGKQ
ncbi:MAG: preprotein translocase subunit SecA [Planctomycetota bacterium]|nr:preprotein translocase subunit SecA [Planctomycetota bacterium]MDA1112916.1 preprotein translocase subunit SecA [Planctomycetota bacterium]